MADEKTIYRMKTPSGDPVRVEEAWKDASGELLTEKVNKADAQTITGLKTFSTLPQSSATPSDDKDLATKKYSDDLWATRKAQEEKCYQALKTVTKDFTRTDPVYVRIGDDGEPEIDVIDSVVRSYASMNLGSATLNIHMKDIKSSIAHTLNGVTAKKVVYKLSNVSITDAYGWCWKSIIPTVVLEGDYMFSGRLEYAFYQSSIKAPPEISNATITNVGGCFDNCSRLKYAPAWDCSAAANMNGALTNCESMSKIGFYGMKVSFDVHWCALKRDAILEVFNNLGSGVAEGTTLTLGSSKLALMSDDEKKIATDKGWTLA